MEIKIPFNVIHLFTGMGWNLNEWDLLYLSFSNKWHPYLNAEVGKFRERFLIPPQIIPVEHFMFYVHDWRLLIGKTIDSYKNVEGDVYFEVQRHHWTVTSGPLAGMQITKIYED